MSRGRVRFTQADLTRAIKAVVESGAPLKVVILKDGTIEIRPLNENDGSSRSNNLWDQPYRKPIIL